MQSMIGCLNSAEHKVRHRVRTVEARAMKKHPRPANLLLDLEARQEEVIVRLEELDREIEKVLAQYVALKTPELPPTEARASSNEAGLPFPRELRKAG